MKDLYEQYKEWRKVSLGMQACGWNGSCASCEDSAREDFSNFAGLTTTISLQQMMELEEKYCKETK